MRALLFVLLLAGCSLKISPEDAPLEGELHVIAVDAAFTDEEYADFEDAAAMWREQTRGRFNARVTRGDSDELKVYRGELPPVLDPVDISKKLGGRAPLKTFISSAKIATPDGVRSMAANAMGRFVGMQEHNLCGVLGRTCIVPELTEADRTSCRRAGACD